MMYPNRNALWGTLLLDELAAAGVDAVCVAPGSRSTPLTVAAAESDLRAYSHLDERSAAYFALGRARRTGRPTPLVCTSGTAAANFHPAVIEASQSRVPMVLLTADRPPELRDSGANQTIDQEKLYGDAVRDYRTLPEPDTDARALRSLRTTVSRAVATATGTPPGPVHLNVPFEKPLEPIEVPGDVPEDLVERAPVATGREGPFVAVERGTPTLADDALSRLAWRVEAADRGLIVAGPANDPTPDRAAAAALAAATGFPLLADPLSGLRFGDHVGADGVTVCGAYDAYVGEPGPPDPDLVLRFGASPTSKRLRKHLADTGAETVVVDPAGGWREAEFAATDLVVADPTRLARGLVARLEDGTSEAAPTRDYRERFVAAERIAREVAAAGHDERLFEGTVAATVAAALPDPSTLYVSNSMPVRDIDRFAEPRSADLSVLGNRGASGIDGITSSALGAGSGVDEPLALLIGDLAYYHDMNGLLALSRCGVDATVVLVNNDGGGIFHKLPIEGFDPPFTDQFRTPHGLDFEPTGELYDLAFERVEGRGALREAVAASAGAPGTRVIEVRLDGEASHRFREELGERVRERVRGAGD